MKKILLCLVIVALSSCKTTSGKQSGIKEGDLPNPMEMDFCNDQGISDLQKLKEVGLDYAVWRKAFDQGKASKELIPTRDLGGQSVLGAGHTLILNKPALSGFADSIWNGKVFTTNEDRTKTTLVNQFIQGSGTTVVKLFSANVDIDQGGSKLKDGDSKPVILLDYRNSQFVDPDSGAINPTPRGGVPIIRAVRDEIRLVCQKTGSGTRKRLYLGPTFLMPGQFYTALGQMIGVPFERDPILWFALEFNEELKNY